jgi:hypothetical protein
VFVARAPIAQQMHMSASPEDDDDDDEQNDDEEEINRPLHLPFAGQPGAPRLGR